MSDERFTLRKDSFGEHFISDNVVDMDFTLEWGVKKLNEQQATIKQLQSKLNAFTRYFEWCPQTCKAIMYFMKKKENEEVMRIIKGAYKE